MSVGDAFFRGKVFVAAPRELPPLPPPLPPAEEPATLAGPDDMPTTAKRLLGRAQGLGWAVQALRARGPYSATETADMAVLRFAWTAGPPDVVAIWFRRGDGKWKFEKAILRDPLLCLNSADLGAWITGGTDAEAPERTGPTSGAAALPGGVDEDRAR